MNPAPYLMITTVLLLNGCSSSNDDPDSLTDLDANSSGNTDGESGSSGETSEPAPGGGDDQPVLSSTPGGDTSVIAGYWDGSQTDEDERYVVIATNGLWTEYFLTYEGDTAGNCYWVTEPQTLTPEDPAANAYSLADGRALTLTADEAGTALTVEYILEDRALETWPAVVGRVPEDLPLCTE